MSHRAFLRKEDNSGRRWCMRPGSFDIVPSLSDKSESLAGCHMYSRSRYSFDPGADAAMRSRFGHLGSLSTALNRRSLGLCSQSFLLYVAGAELLRQRIKSWLWIRREVALQSLAKKQQRLPAMEMCIA